MPTSTTAGKRRATISGASSIAVAVLLTLLAANLAALVVLAWRFLPDVGVGVGVGGTTTPAGAGAAHVRGRSDGPDGPTVEALRRTLFRDPIVRYDVVPAALDRIPGARGVVHQLPSIPDRRRMLPNAGGGERRGDFGFVVPPDATRNLTYFLEARLREDEEDRPLFLYNPSVLPLDGTRIGDAILRDLGVRPGDAGPPGAPRYVATFRVSNFGNCHGPGRGVPDTYRNYLGLALLDARLDVVRDPEGGTYLDAVIDLNKRLWEVNWSPGGGRGRPREPKQYMQDCQLFAAASPSEGGGTGGGDGRADRLILLCNEYAVPVRLRVRGGGNGPDENAGNRDDEAEAIRFENTYGSGLQLTALRRPNMILRGGKNLHYIPPAAGVDGGGHLEIWPGGPHEVLLVDFSRYPYVERGGGGGRGPLETSKSSRAEPDPSFPTMDYALERKAFIDRDSGSACCVSVLWRDDDDHHRGGGDGGGGGARRLLLGFSHRKTRRQPRAGMYNYVSRVYAFEPYPPFDVVARSGYFCLGFATDDEALRSDNEQVRGAAGEYRLKVREEEFDCPRIHFVTGIAEKPGDEGTVIVSYGVNDCYPRMAEVSKDFLVALLKGQHR